MLLVILGAGASYDSSPFWSPVTTPRDLRPSMPSSARPPLTLELFDRERPQFTFLERYPAAAAVVRHIQRELADGSKNVEQILGELQLEEDEHPQRKRHLMALRFYLRDYLRDCSERWWSFHSGVLTYVEFVDVLHRFSVRTGERVCYLSFNYDTLLDRTLEGQHLRGLQHIDGYVADDGPLYLKFHGSVNWRRKTSVDFASPGIKQPDDVIGQPPEPAALADDDEYIVESDEGEQWDYDVGYPSNKMQIPALAIPVEQKTDRNFEIPRAHRDLVGEVIGDATRVLIIGWRGAEQHFNGVLRDHAPGLALPFTLVCGAEGGAETEANLSEYGFCEFRDTEAGFTEFVDKGALRAFVEE